LSGVANLDALKEVSKMSKKREKNQNRLTHGAYSREVILPGEKLSDYEALRAALYEEWVPIGVTEQSLVEDLCKLLWKKRRLDQYDQIRLKQRKDYFYGRNYGNKHRSNLKDLAEEFNEATSVEATEAVLSQLSPIYVACITKWVPRENCTDPTQWGPAIGKYLSDLKAEDPLKGPDLFAAIVDPRLMEAEILRSDRLDEAIDRKIQQLLKVKTAKHVFPNMRKNTKSEPKLINAPASADQQPVLIDQNEPKPAADTGSIVPAKSGTEKEVLTAQSGVVVQGTLIDEGKSAPAEAEKLQFGIAHAKVDFFAKPAPTPVEELQRFSALCERVKSSMASSDRGSSPNAGPT
jgi:hypothetical protein